MVSKTVYGARDQEILYYGQFFFYHIVSMVVKIELEVRMAVKIVRVLNTNAVVSSDQEGRELIITGAGIGFKKKKGENLDEALADKTYYLESVDDSRRLQEVVKEISEEYLEIVSRIVKTAREEGLKVRDSLYVTLTDHINSAVDRYRENIALKNMMKLEIRKFYPKEYEIGLRAVQWIQEQNDENLGEDEAAFIAMHIVSAELGSESNVDVNKITKLINAVLQIVRIHFKIEFNEKSISYERFLTHLKFFATRVFDNTIYQDSMGVNYYQSCVCEYNPMDGVTPYGTMNTTGVKGSAQELGMQGIYKNPVNPYLMTTDWDWTIDPMGLRFCCREITSRYGLPIVISENGLGAFDKKTEDDQIHDEYRIHYLEEHLKELGKAIEEGCEVLAYCTWSFTDLLSWLNGYQKRYGFVYVDREEEEGGTLNRYKKDSFYWYQGVIKSDGENLYK